MDDFLLLSLILNSKSSVFVVLVRLGRAPHMKNEDCLSLQVDIDEDTEYEEDEELPEVDDGEK